MNEAETRAELIDPLLAAPQGQHRHLHLLRRTGVHLLALNVAYALQPIPREASAEHARLYIHSKFTSKQQLFLNFVLQHYVMLGVQELAQEKLPPPKTCWHTH